MESKWKGDWREKLFYQFTGRKYCFKFSFRPNPEGHIRPLIQRLADAISKVDDSNSRKNSAVVVPHFLKLCEIEAEK